MKITIIINFIIIIIITTPISTLANINILQKVKFKIIAMTMIKVYGCIVKIIILTINNSENGHDICHGYQLGHHQHHHYHCYAQYWLDPIESRLLNNNAWHHIQPL